MKKTETEKATIKENKRIKKILLGMIRKDKPTHGVCCTCQECGYPNDWECQCSRNHLIEELIKTL